MSSNLVKNAFRCTRTDSEGSLGAKASDLLQRDFCPWANKYVYWLKEPVGWFVLATAVSVLVGAFLSPLGWSLAAGLSAVLILGLGFPWLATRTLHCRLRPVRADLHERDASYLELQVQNRLPIPVSGLMVEGYLSQPLPDGQASDGAAIGGSGIQDVGLARIPALSMATYRLPICPEYRGRYPMQPPNIACAFPFGIWTARRSLQNVEPVTVRPLLIPISGAVEFSGVRLAEVGNGQRPTTQGDFLGVRDFRRGDSLRSIHWAQSARQDEWIVCERGGPQQQIVELHLSTVRGLGTAGEARENLAWRVRIAASFIDLLVARHLPFQLYIDDQLQPIPEGGLGGRRAWDRLANIPLDGFANTASAGPKTSRNQFASRIQVAADDGEHELLPSHMVRVEVQHPSRGIRAGCKQQMRLLDLDADISDQLNELLLEADRDSQAA